MTSLLLLVIAFVLYSDHPGISLLIIAIVLLGD